MNPGGVGTRLWSQHVLVMVEIRSCQQKGLDEKTIGRGREEMNESLESRPIDRVRLEGGGRPLVEKKDRR
jgi:hypothetical protein